MIEKIKMLFPILSSAKAKYIVLPTGIKRLFWSLLSIALLLIISEPIINKLLTSNPIVKNIVLIFNSFSILSKIIIGFSILILIYILLVYSKKYSPIKDIYVSELESTSNFARKFKVTIFNNSAEQIIIRHFVLRWRYLRGNLLAIEEGKLIKPSANFSITFGINVLNTETKEHVYYPESFYVIPPKTILGSSASCFTIELAYFFEGKLNYHPRCDWNIAYSLDAVDTKGRHIQIIDDFRWRYNDSYQQYKCTSEAL